MDVEELDSTPAASFSLEEDLVNETVTNNDECDTEMSQEILSPQPGATARTRTLSATYTFPDPEEPSKNLVLEFPLSPPQIQTPMPTDSTLIQDLEMKTSFEDFTGMTDAITSNEFDDESLKSHSESMEKPVDVSDDQSINQSKASRVQPTAFSCSRWFSYMQQRVQQNGYPQQRSALERQKNLFKYLTEDHAYGQLHLSAGEGKTASPITRSKKTLFFTDHGLNTVAGGDSTVEEGEENLIVDVVSGEHPPSTGGGMVPYDRQRALMAMNEVVRFMLYIHGPVELETTPGKEGKIEEDPLTKTYARRGTWTSRQRSFFDSCVKILQNERHVRLGSVGVMDEPIIRRLSLDKSAGRFRRLMASVEWNGRLVYWLHAILMEGLNSQMLAIYFEILQTLKPKIPELVNSLLNYMLPTVNVPGANIDGLMPLMDNPWDPIGKSVYRFDKAIKLPKNPIIVVAPHPYSQGQENVAHSRIHSILKFLTRLGTVVQVDGGSNDNYTPSDLYKNMLLSTRDTLIDLRKMYPERPLVMIGLGIGSMVACQASLLEACAAIVCFGFPLKTPRGIHGDYGDPLLKIDAAVQFILGLDAANCPQAEFHDFWDKLNCDTEVVWSAGCDDYLRMKASAKMSLKMTQSMVDRCFLEVMIQFLQQALLKERTRRVEIVAPDLSKKRKAKPSSSVRTPTKKPKIELSPDLGDGTSKKDLLISESTTSSQDMSTGGSQSSMDTIPAELQVLSETAIQSQGMPPSTTLSASLMPQSSVAIEPARSKEQSTLSIHFTTQQVLVDPRRRPDMFDGQRKPAPDSNANRNFWSTAVPNIMPNDGRGVARPSLPRMSVIAHTNTRLPSAALLFGDTSSTSSTVKGLHK